MKKPSVLLILLVDNFLHECHSCRMNGKKVPKSFVADEVTIDEETALAISEIRDTLSVTRKEEFDKQSVESQIAFAKVSKDFFSGVEIVIGKPEKKKPAKSEEAAKTTTTDPKE